MTPDKTALEAADEMLLRREMCAERLRDAVIYLGISKLSNPHWPDKAIWHYSVDCYWYGGEKPATEKYHFGHMEAVLAFLRTGIDKTPPSETEVEHE
jgi:hypothetical protein